MGTEYKQFKDPIYGYITIPSDIVKNIIDTNVFQRLRRITQTSYSPLYPSAIHNRFVHSIGVYYLGVIACDSLLESIKDIKDIKEKCKSISLDRLREVFLLACLLHDVGHAPFSHTGEMFYLDDPENGTQRYQTLYYELAKCVNTESFRKEIPTEESKSAAPHEVMSAIIGLSDFSDCFEKDIEKEFFARCITGHKYLDDYDEKSLYLIAKAGEGSVRDMLSIADSVASFCDNKIDYQSAEKVIGLSNRENIKNILLAIANKDMNSLFLSIKSALGAGKNIQVLCKEMADFIKNLIMIKVGVTDYSVLDILPGDFNRYAEIANLFEVDYLKSAFSKFAKIELDLKYSLNPENLFESACLELLSDGGKAQNTENIPTKNASTPVQNSAVEKVSEIKREQSEIEKIWGNVLLKVKQNNMFAFSNALNNVNKVEEIAHKLIVHTNDLSSFETIDNKERIDVLLKLVKLFDDSIVAVEVEYDKNNASSQDIKDNLKDVFKSKIKFKE